MCTRRSGPDIEGRVITITNRNLGAVDDQWICEPLERVELTAKAIYYITRALAFLE